MARALRIEYPGAVYHVMSRGDHNEPIYQDDKDREMFLETLDGACGKTGWWIHAYVLMDNHYHMPLETPDLWSRNSVGFEILDEVFDGG
jgi:REP element-mobilizing transposase RayT